jgi:hypothetical protein
MASTQAAAESGGNEAVSAVVGGCGGGPRAGAGDNCPAMEDRDAIAHPADRPQPTLAA